MEFSRQEYWNGLPFPYPEALPNPGIEPGSPGSITGRLYSPSLENIQRTYLYINNSYSIIKRQTSPTEKGGKMRQVLHKGKCTGGQLTYEKILNIIMHQENKPQ